MLPVMNHETFTVRIFHQMTDWVTNLATSSTIRYITFCGRGKTTRVWDRRTELFFLRKIWQI
jgi:hypothetical protein